MGNNKNMAGRKPEHAYWGSYFVPDTGRNYSYLIYQRPHSRMETALIKGVLSGLTLLGIPSFILHILNNIGAVHLDNWMLWVLFVLAALMLIARFVVFCIKSWQDIRYRERKLRDKR